MSSTVPYIGSKISLVSNSDIRYEGILYTINTQESTIALQSVRCCGTEGRKVPEIPPSSEIYDFIIFRGQDIKDLTVLESANPAFSAQLNDPAIMSVNQRPAGGAVGAKGGGGGGANTSAFTGKNSGGSYGKATAKGSANQQSGNDKNWSGWGAGWQRSDNRFQDNNVYRGGGGGGGTYAWRKDGGGHQGKGGGGGQQKGMDTCKGGKSVGKGKAKGGKTPMKGGGGNDRTGKGAGSGCGGADRSPHSGGAGGRRSGVDTAGGTPVGELLPSTNEAVKSEYAEEFDYATENGKFDKVVKVEGEEIDEKLKPLSGYDKVKSFFDNISCERTERAGEAERPKVDRNKARQNDRETFGDTRRPPRPTGGRRGKGAWMGGPRGYRP